MAGILAFAENSVSASTLVVTNYDGGEIEWVSIQADNSPEGKLADTGTPVVYGNKTVLIPLKDIKTEGAFDDSGKFIVVLKHKGSPKWMYIKNGVQFTNGGASVKWGLWFPWRDSSN
jgi:hypothetical protein